MRAWLIILGIVVGLGGVLCYWAATPEWRLWWFFTTDNPLSFLYPLSPYSYIIMIVGFILFVVGLVPRGGGD